MHVCCWQEDDQGLTVQCALEGNCVLLRRDTLLSEALSLLDEEEQSVALVVSLPAALPSIWLSLLSHDRSVWHCPIFASCLCR